MNVKKLIANGPLNPCGLLKNDDGMKIFFVG